MAGWFLFGVGIALAVPRKVIFIFSIFRIVKESL